MSMRTLSMKKVNQIIQVKQTFQKVPSKCQRVIWLNLRYRVSESLKEPKKELSLHPHQLGQQVLVILQFLHLR